MATKFTNVTFNVSEGNTVPAIDYIDYPIFPNIGSGTIAKLSWSTPVASGNAVDYYKLDIMAYNLATGSYTTVFSGSIGNVNEYYITSSLLSAVGLANYKLYIYLSAISKYGAAYDSPASSKIIYICDACGTYMKVTDGYSQPVMKRTVAFANLGYKVLYDDNGKVVTDANGKTMYIKSSSVQDLDSGWAPMQDFYTKDASGNWHTSDIQYEALVDANSDVVTDINNEIVYVL